MPKKYREVRAALLGAGSQVVRQRGSHEVWAHRDRDERIVVALGTTREETADRIHEALDAYTDDLHERPAARSAR